MKTFRASDGAAIFLKAIIINLALQIIASIVSVALVMSGVVGDKGENILNLCFTILLQGGFLLAYFTTAKKQKRKCPIPIKYTGVTVIIISLLLSAVSVFCFAYTAQWFDFLLQKIGYNSMVDIEFSSPIEIVLVVLATAVLAPICEELVFRGALFGGLLKKMKVVPAVLLSGLCFAFMHMNPEQTVYQFILGVVSALLAYYSGSLIPSITLHAGNNIIAVIVSLVPASGSEELKPSLDFLWLTLAMLAVGIGLVYAGITILKKINAKRAKTTSEGDTISVGNSLRLSLLDEEARDEIDEQEGVIASPLLGKKSHLILTYITLGVCALMWLLTFGAGLLM